MKRGDSASRSLAVRHSSARNSSACFFASLLLILWLVAAVTVGDQSWLLSVCVVCVGGLLVRCQYSGSYEQHAEGEEVRQSTTVRARSRAALNMMFFLCLLLPGCGRRTCTLPSGKAPTTHIRYSRACVLVCAHMRALACVLLSCVLFCSRPADRGTTSARK